jgi:hypothetical protein
LLWGLKKQSQFAPARMGAKSYMKGDYEDKPARGAEENKANLPAPKGQTVATARKKGITRAAPCNANVLAGSTGDKIFHV